ncbi:MAG: hypothetical protein A2571_00860 [Candidatus Vogelbacteria bacterium RIFOXYD1_FULL_44_32]|uniref:BioF2-like acetyltransferase domain-containing protein n=1 Tax=Candidatus Vogelbacteria bacterium RIFOXYD1_FULL_44_32 TaxID=1802438 RepID=A0A1G2QE86_9BACT|nr:MAG: hypothetical protein A2571_00860 [Candidatus Vogelbacteria bacterium RIFOXYD1_FULL_44_32]
MSTNQFTINAIEGPLYDTELSSHNAHFAQSSLYRDWQENRGLTVERFVIKENGAPALFFQIITAPLIGNKNQLHIPHGPILLTSTPSEDLIREFKKQLIRIAQVRQAVFVRFNQDLKYQNLFTKHFSFTPPAIKHSVLTQPRFEWVMDISQDINNIFDSLPKDTRYSIRTAEKRGAETQIITENFLDHLDNFYKLLNETAKRNHFQLHPKSYYEKVLIETEKSHAGFLVVTSFDNEPLVINLLIIFGNTALHIFGGSSAQHKDKLPSYLAHWAGINEAKKRLATKYSFGGISTPNDKKESWADLTNFKKNFPGTEVDFGPSYDLPIKRLWYYLYIFRKLIRR